MKHIHTTQTKINRIKSMAKKRKKEIGTQLSRALEEIAKEQGYDNYQHAITCYKNSKTTED